MRLFGPSSANYEVKIVLIGIGRYQCSQFINVVFVLDRYQIFFAAVSSDLFINQLNVFNNRLFKVQQRELIWTSITRTNMLSIFRQIAAANSIAFFLWINHCQRANIRLLS